MTRTKGALLIVFICCLLAAALAVMGLRQAVGGAEGDAVHQDAGLKGAAPPVYVGAESCKACHAQEYTGWQGSVHQKAMAHATDATVEGNFNGATLVNAGVTTHFFRRGGGYFVNTDGPDGKLHDYQVKYTFGVSPLQQYLVAFPDGRIQVLPLAWDNRPVSAGGQRWYSMHPGENISAADPLHWTGINQNWNYMCAECHSTNLSRGYDVKLNRFNTHWTDINVACEACHGPGSLHVARAKAWAAAKPGKGPKKPDDGLLFHYGAPAAWILDEATGNSTRAAPRREHHEIDACGLCHSRRYAFKEGMQPGQPLLDSHLVSLLDQGLYFPDGQMQAEVYTYGSFLQSRMYAKGVTCSDCHEPHSLKLRAPGNGLCTQCHAAGKYDAPSHYHHDSGSAGAKCVSCHMPEHIYMQIQPRHDHSLRVPRPDLSVALGTPNACNDCHKDKSPAWAAKAIEGWFGPTREGLQAYGPALAAAHQELPSAPGLLAQIVGDPSQPAIARGTAYAAYAGYLTPGRVALVAKGLSDPDPLVRLGAMKALEALPVTDRRRLFAPLLRDPIAAVRLRAAANLADVPMADLTPEAERDLKAAFKPYLQSLEGNFDRPEAHVEAGLFYLKQGQADAAEKAYLDALKLVPDFPQAVINLSDLYRQSGRDAEAEKLLRQAIGHNPDFAAAHHALGLLLIRRHQLALAMPELAQAVRQAPDQMQYAYVYAVALDAVGQLPKALQLLEENHRRHPSDGHILAALVSYNRKAGNDKVAARYLQKLQALETAP